MSPRTLLTSMCKLTRLGMARKTPSNPSLPGSTPSCLGLAVTSSICKTKSKTLMTGGWLGRSPTSTNSIKRPQSSPYKLKSCRKSSTRLATPGLCPRSGLSSPGHLKRLPGLRTSQGRLACHTLTPITRTMVDEDISSNWRVMSLALRTPGSYRSPCLM